MKTVTLIKSLGLKYNSVGSATNIKPTSWANKMQGREKFTLTQQLSIELYLRDLTQKLNTYFYVEAQPALSFSATPEAELVAPQGVQIAEALKELTPMQKAMKQHMLQAIGITEAQAEAEDEAYVKRMADAAKAPLDLTDLPF